MNSGRILEQIKETISNKDSDARQVQTSIEWLVNKNFYNELCILFKQIEPMKKPIMAKHVVLMALQNPNREPCLIQLIRESKQSEARLKLVFESVLGKYG
jgi:AraC-like DNA-binding protein